MRRSGVAGSATDSSILDVLQTTVKFIAAFHAAFTSFKYQKQQSEVKER